MMPSFHPEAVFFVALLVIGALVLAVLVWSLWPSKRKPPAGSYAPPSVDWSKLPKKPLPAKYVALTPEQERDECTGK